jgi:hypothetical protein
MLCRIHYVCLHRFQEQDSRHGSDDVSMSLLCCVSLLILSQRLRESEASSKSSHLIIGSFSFLSTRKEGVIEDTDNSIIKNNKKKKLSP